MSRIFEIIIIIIYSRFIYACVYVCQNVISILVCLFFYYLVPFHPLFGDFFILQDDAFSFFVNIFYIFVAHFLRSFKVNVNFVCHIFFWFLSFLLSGPTIGVACFHFCICPVWWLQILSSYISSRRLVYYFSVFCLRCMFRTHIIQVFPLAYFGCFVKLNYSFIFIDYSLRYVFACHIGFLIVLQNIVSIYG